MAKSIKMTMPQSTLSILLY